jgi:hypothetical protein
MDVCTDSQILQRHKFPSYYKPRIWGCKEAVSRYRSKAFIGRAMAQAVSWPSLICFVPGSYLVGFVVDKMGLEQGFFRVLLFSPVSIMSLWFYIHILPEG